MKPMWQPSKDRICRSSMFRYLDHLKKTQTSGTFNTYNNVYQWSVTSLGEFWSSIAEFSGVRWIQPPSQAYSPPPTGHILGAKWFENGKLSFAENLLRPVVDKQAVICAYAEGRQTHTTLSGKDVWNQTAATAAALKKLGVKKGDRVAAVIANVPEAIVAMLGTTSIGAIWSSCSPDFGEQGILDRFQQIEPTVLFCTKRYSYNGKIYDCAATAEQCLKKLPSVKQIVFIDHLAAAGKADNLEFGWDWHTFLATSGIPFQDSEIQPIHFEPQSFSDPLFILFSSGTTGVPKCIVHGAGGTLLQLKKELSLHSDIGPSDNLLYYTTCGWMMWNWMVAGLSVGASLTLYEGSVNYPRPDKLWSLVKDTSVTVFGTSAKYIAYSIKEEVNPSKFNAGLLRTILSTGSPLLPEHFDWIYKQYPDVHLASISGGTDIISCFVLGNPLLPVFRGEIQGPGLGMKVEAWDESGRAVQDQKGELVCTEPFVSMPISFWNDPGQKAYQKAYFEHFRHRQVWRHGDFIEINSQTKGVTIFGRSDATLNPGGVRIGTAELYRVVESFAEVADSIVVGKRTKDDEVIVLFLKLKVASDASDQLVQAIKAKIREKLTPRHVPRHVIYVSDIPYTRSGKKVELAVQNAIHQEAVKNKSALANSECLEEYWKIGQKLKE